MVPSTCHFPRSCSYNCQSVRSLHPNHTGMRQMTPNSLRGRHLLASLQGPLTTCNNLHLTWKWLMGSPQILTSMLINYHTLSHTFSKLKGQTIAWLNIMTQLLTTPITRPKLQWLPCYLEDNHHYKECQSA